MPSSRGIRSRRLAAARRDASGPLPGLKHLLTSQVWVSTQILVLWYLHPLHYSQFQKSLTELRRSSITASAVCKFYLQARMNGSMSRCAFKGVPFRSIRLSWFYSLSPVSSCATSVMPWPCGAADSCVRTCTALCKYKVASVYLRILTHSCPAIRPKLKLLMSGGHLGSSPVRTTTLFLLLWLRTARSSQRP